jgi:enoyl-[acyl-carrier protein] reductase II
MSTIATRFTAEYGITRPIASAAMAFVTITPALPIAVCRAGALGAYAAGILPLDLIRDALRQIKEATDGPLNLNFITPFASDEHIDLCVEARPAVASFHWGHPARAWIYRLQAAGIKVWEQVGTPDDARRALDDGMDLIIAQGSEAGGHCYGALPTFVATPAIVDAAEGALVLAAGGIADGRGLAAALALGADGAMVGTRLLATLESDVADEYKQRVVAAGPLDTELSSMFGRDIPDFNPMRVVRNRLVAEWHGREQEIDALPPQPVIGSMMLAGQPIELRRFAGALPIRGATGDFDQMPLTAGQGLGSIAEVLPAGDVIDALVADAAAILENICR